MIGFLILLLHVLVSPFKTQARLEAEIVPAASVECAAAEGSEAEAGTVGPTASLCGSVACFQRR